jgi:hypothetical protein
MTLVQFGVSDDIAKRFKTNKGSQSWDVYLTSLLDSADMKMSEYELETLRILEEKKKRIESRKR